MKNIKAQKRHNLSILHGVGESITADKEEVNEDAQDLH